MSVDPNAAKAIFMTALDKSDPAERAAYLAEACGGDEMLRQRVELLLKAHSDPGSFLESSAPAFVATVDDPISERPGTMIGPYKLLQQIGEGGMGTVFMAEQTEPVKRKVALKIIKAGMDSKQVIARFEAERQALAMMDHVNIARVLDAGTIGFSIDDLRFSIEGKDDPDQQSKIENRKSKIGRPYFVMELVHGVPITKYCDDNRLTPRERLELFVPVCQAIQHAHQKGIIHRDIKPSNVMVTLYDGKPVPKVIDFGVAKATEQKLTERTLFTQYGLLVGTPQYMSPEQAEMSALGVDTRSDIYSLGVLLYELLTGSTPLSRKRMKEAAYAEILRMIKEEEPPKPSTRLSDSGEALASISANRHTEPAKLTKLVRGELDWIVMKCLEKDRNRRYETANGFAQDVQRYLADETVQAGPPSVTYRLRKFVRRNRVALLTIGVVVLALITGTVVSAWQAVRATLAEETSRFERDNALAEKERADEEAAIAKAVTAFLQNDLLAEAAPDKNARDKKVTVEEVLRRASTRIAGKFAQQPRIEAAIRQTISDTYRKLGDYPAAQQHTERALDIRRRVLGEEHPDTLTSMNNLAELYEAQGQYAQAESLNAKTLEVRRRILGEEHPDTLTSTNNLALMLAYSGQLPKAEPILVKTLEVRRRVLGEEHPDTLNLMNSLAAIYRYQSQYAQAESLNAKTLEVRRRILGEEHPETLHSMNSLAAVYRAQGQFPKAEPLCLKVLEVRRRVLGAVHDDTLDSMNNLAGLYWSMQKYDHSIPLFEETLRLKKAHLGPDHPSTLVTTANLGVNYLDARRLAEAFPYLEEALERIRRRTGPLTSELAYAPSTIAAGYERAGQFVKAEPLRREALATMRKRHAEASPRTAGALAALGLNLLEQNRFADAESLLREALKIRETMLPDDWTTFNTQSMLGGSLLGQQQYAEAEPLLVAGYEGVMQRQAKVPNESTKCLTETLERLVQLYDATGQKDQAAAWRTKLEARKEADKKARKLEQK